MASRSPLTTRLVYGKTVRLPVRVTAPAVKKTPPCSARGVGSAPTSPPCAPDAPVSEGALKKSYLQAVRLIHPDKTVGQPPRQRLVAESVFTVLSAVWELYSETKAGGGSVKAGGPGLDD